jgi:MOSC domain-containing protein YiiM
MTFRTIAELEPHLDHLAASPTDVGRLELLVCRPAKGTRRLLDEGLLDTEVGLVGDSWSTRPGKPPRPDKQVTLMNARMAGLLSQDPHRQALCGDQLYVDLDLSAENLPAGTRIEIGDAVVEVSAAPHNGCAIFVQHFGADATRFVNGREGRQLRLRGINARVVTGGAVRPGDRVGVHRLAQLW